MAFRLLHARRELCDECMSHWTYNPRRNKSYLAKNLLDRVTPNLLTIAKTKGEKALRDAGPHIPRDWSGVRPGDWFVSDDETPNHRAWRE